MCRDQYTYVLEVLTQYVSARLLGEDNAHDLTGRTPLIELGVLNSIQTARLVTYVRKTFGVRLPPASMTANNFRDLETIAGLVVSHQQSSAGEEPAVPAPVDLSAPEGLQDDLV